ncbi:MAG: hypothetical protein ACOYOH_00415 [Paracraurococcus sp.]
MQNTLRTDEMRPMKKLHHDFLAPADGLPCRGRNCWKDRPKRRSNLPPDLPC